MTGKKAPGRNQTPHAQQEIYSPPYDKTANYPEELRDVFELIHRTRYLQEERFGAHRIGDGPNNHETKAAHNYNMDLKAQAEHLKHVCRDVHMKDALESKWVMQLHPLVFSGMDRMEERRVFHLCFICRRYYPPDSRPLINSSGMKGSKSLQRGEAEKGREDFEICEVNDRHFNLPNFTLFSELSYYDSENSRQAPDATLGLHTYILNHLPWIEREDLLKNDRIRLFDRIELDALLRHFELKAPYENRGSESGMNLPLFAFGLWEAKRSIKTDTHQEALSQTAPQLRALLRWQRQIYDKAQCPGCPLVWFFSSVGSSWEIVGCYEERRSNRNEDPVYPFIKLWYGNLDHSDAALQLLYVVDVIKIWAEHTYKPAIGSCISRLKTMKNNEPLVALEDTLWKAQIAINRRNFQWLFDLDQPEEKALHSSSISDKLQVNHVPNPSSRGTAQKAVLHRSPKVPTLERLSTRPGTRARTPVGERYMLPELQDYVWLLDRDPRHRLVPDIDSAHEGLLSNDPGRADLLILRVTESGRVLRPIVIFGSADWHVRTFEKILRDERQRHNPRTQRCFKIDSKGRRYLWKGVFAEPNYFAREEQFCAILPLSFRDYESQCSHSKKEEKLFEPLEEKLGISKLLELADNAYRRWCECERFYDDSSPDMVLCDNVKCRIGWFHCACVGLDEGFEPVTSWLCNTCADLPFDQCVFVKDMDLDYETVADKSSYRVHRTRTLRKVWDDHDWPSEADVRETFDEIARNLDIVSSFEVRVRKRGDYRHIAQHGNWVLAKKKPEKLILAVSRKRHLAYHQETATEEDHDSSDNSAVNGYTSSDYESTAEIEKDLGSMGIHSGPNPSGSKNPFSSGSNSILSSSGKKSVVDDCEPLNPLENESAFDEDLESINFSKSKRPVIDRLFDAVSDGSKSSCTKNYPSKGIFGGFGSTDPSSSKKPLEFGVDPDGVRPPSNKAHSSSADPFGKQNISGSDVVSDGSKASSTKEASSGNPLEVFGSTNLSSSKKPCDFVLVSNGINPFAIKSTSDESISGGPSSSMNSSLGSKIISPKSRDRHRTKPRDGQHRRRLHGDQKD